MKVKTLIGMNGEWEIEVHTLNSCYKKLGEYYSFCYMKNYRGETIRLVSGYSNDEKSAIEYHQEMCQKAKDFFALKRVIS